MGRRNPYSCSINNATAWRVHKAKVSVKKKKGRKLPLLEQDSFITPNYFLAAPLAAGATCLAVDVASLATFGAHVPPL